MCGRYTIAKPQRIVVTFTPDVVTSDAGTRARYNIAPGQDAPVLRASSSGTVLADHRWGLVPSWARDPAIGQRMINARAETVAGKPSFRTALRRRRCLVPADGFYEWKKTPGGKQPVYIRVDDGEPFAMAGLYETRGDGDERLDTFTIITTEPNRLMAGIHHRMPVILTADTWSAWLDPARREPADVTPFLQPFDAARMQAYDVSKTVNSPAHDSPACIEPA